MEEKMNKLSPVNGKKAGISRIFDKKFVFWLGVVVVFLVTAVTVYAVLPAISLNSPTSFPVDI
jgi:hypothetical protein